MEHSVVRRVGIPGTSHAQSGEHLCAFFYTKTDLLNLVVPYIKAGLEDREFVSGSPKTTWNRRPCRP